MRPLFVLLQYLVPQHLITRLCGFFAACRWPVLKNPMIRLFIARYDVNMAEAAEPDYRAYACFNDFFTRALRADARPLQDSADGRALLSPADGTVSAIGDIRDGHVFQAKGHDFSLLELLGGDAAAAERFEGGRFATIYLSPRDYHRVHMPCAGTLRQTTFIPGRLFSVNQLTAEHIPGLFARNERLVCLFDTEIGPMAMILVGAMIVGGIETVWAGTEQRTRVPVTRHYAAAAATAAVQEAATAGAGGAFDLESPESPAPSSAGGQVPALAKGEEMGRFKLGSTVILLFGPDAVEWSARLDAGAAIYMGQQLGTRAGTEPDL